MRTLSTTLLVLTLLLSGCATSNNSKYAWGNYESALYDYYKAPANIAEYQAALKAIIDAAATSTPPQRVPPGIYAEYGYLLMLQRQYDAAIQYFEREKAGWPEAAPFMDTMIKVANNDVHQTKDQNPSAKEQTSANAGTTTPSPSATTP